MIRVAIMIMIRRSAKLFERDLPRAPRARKVEALPPRAFSPGGGCGSRCAPTLFRAP